MGINFRQTERRVLCPSNCPLTQCSPMPPPIPPCLSSKTLGSQESRLISHPPHPQQLFPTFLWKRKFSSLPGLGLPASASYSQRGRRDCTKQRILTGCLHKAPNEVPTVAGLPQSYLANLALQLVLVQLHPVRGGKGGRQMEASGKA